MSGALRQALARTFVAAVLLWPLALAAPELARLPTRDPALYAQAFTATREERVLPQVQPYELAYAAIQRRVSSGDRIVVLSRVDLGHERVVQAMRAALFPASVQWYQVFLREQGAGRERYDERLCVLELEGAPEVYLGGHFALEERGPRYRLWRYRGERRTP